MLRKNTMLIGAAVLVVLAGSALADTGVATSGLFSLDTADLSPAEGGASLPTVHRLDGCVPNPFNPTTTIKYYLAQAAPVTLSIFDMRGRHVETILHGSELPAGSGEAVWRGCDSQGRAVAGGVYLVRLKVGDRMFHQRVTLVK